MAIVREETVVASGSGTSLSLTSWTPGSNELVLVSIALRNESITPSVSGNGLTFVQVADVDNVQGQNGVTLFRAMGSSPTTGQITVTLTGNSTPVVARAHRFSGVDTSGTNGSGAVEASATHTGPDPDDDDMLHSITTLTDGAWAIAFGTHRAGSFTVPGGETALNINDSSGSGGDATTLSAWYQEVPTAGSTQLGDTADLDSDRDWCLILVSIKPGAGTSAISGTSAGVATTTGALTGRGAAAGTAAGVATASGALGGRAAAVGTSGGVATATATVMGWGHIVGTSAGVATVTGELFIGMAGTAAGVATVTGTLSATWAMVGTSAGVATVAATISSIVAIAGTAAGVATASGALIDANAVIIPAQAIGYNARILIADHTRKIIAEVQFALAPVAWMINDYGTSTITAARTDSNCTADILRPGNWLYVEFDNGLPPWAGVLMPGRSFSSSAVTVQAASAEHYLKRFHTDKGRYFRKAAAAHIFTSVIGEANAAWGMGVKIGEVWGGGTLHSPEYHLESVWGVVVDSIVGRLEDCEFHIEPLLQNGRIELTAHLRQRRGVVRPHVWLMQGHNLTEDEYKEVDELTNHWLMAGDDLNGDGDGWGAGRLLDLATGQDATSMGRHGLWQSAIVEQGIREQSTLSEYARYLISRTAVPRVMACASAVDLAPAKFTDYQVGDTVRLIAPAATFQPLDVQVRVMGREFDFADGVVQLALETV